MKIDLQSIYTTERTIRYDHMGGVQGILNCGMQPRYKQSGSSFVWHPGYYYLAVKIEKASNLEQLEETTDLDVYATVEWNGQVQRTRSVSDAVTPVFNETFFVLIPLGERELNDEQRLVEALKSEFQTKARVWLSLWRKFYGGALMHLGSVAFNLGDIGGAPAEDVTFVTDDKKANIYEARVLAKTLKLSSAFNSDLNAEISFKGWFFYDLPSIFDLAPYIREGDELPRDVENGFKKREYQKRWGFIVNDIYEYSDISRDIRKFDTTVEDHCKRPHFLPLYLSSMSPPDQGTVDINSAPYDHKIRTAGEVAHFVRCVPYIPANSNFWISPDGVLAMQKGTVVDHALLMASMFLGCNYETFESLKKKFRELNKKEKRVVKPEPRSTDKQDIRYYAEHMEDLLKPEVFTIDAELLNDALKAEEKKQGALTENAGGEQPAEDQAPEEEEEEEKSEPETKEDELPFANRVFVCLGTERTTKAPYAWVMTFDPECSNVTFWDPRCHKEYELRARVKEKTFLQEFLKYKPSDDGNARYRYIPCGRGGAGERRGGTEGHRP